MNVSVVIPNYNGEAILKQNLPKVYAALEALPAEKKELIISDDNSQDKSLEVLRKFEEEHKNSKLNIHIVESKVNKGFSSNVNRGVKVASGDILFLLNTDVAPEKDSFRGLMHHFEDPELFAVGCMDRSIEGDKEVLRGRGIGKWERGFLNHSRGENDKTSTLWVSGGSGAFRKEIWDKIGGLDEIFNPFYWEDIDLSYRAMKAGYRIAFDPKSVVVHEHEKGAIKRKFTPEQVRVIVFRNQLTFVWKNITQGSYLLSHIVWLPYHLIRAALRGDTVMLKGFGLALLRLPEVLRHRKKVKELFVMTDKQIIEANSS